MLLITSELRILSIYVCTYVHSKFNLECIAIDCRTLRPQKPSATEALVNFIQNVLYTVDEGLCTQAYIRGQNVLQSV